METAEVQRGRGMGIRSNLRGLHGFAGRLTLRGPALLRASKSVPGLACVSGLVLIAGCAHGPDLEREGHGFTRIFTPQIPTFMIGPASVLLTNSAGYSARATIQNDPTFQDPKPVEGELLCRGSKLLFAPQGFEKVEKDSPAKGFSYVWDVASGTGHIRSEALQAYAPVSTPLRATNLAVNPLAGGRAEATITLSDGSKSVFQTSSAPRGTVPAAIKAVGPPVFELSLAKIGKHAPPEEVFSVPNGFSKYASAEALADELAARQHNLRRGAPLFPTTSGTPEIIRH